MTRFSVACISAFLLLKSVPAQAATIDIASGLLSVGGGLVGGAVGTAGGWASASLSYDVDFNDVNQTYLYNYTFAGTDPVKNISHLITQVSGNFATTDMLAGTTPFSNAGDFLGTQTSGSGNPLLPGTINGIRWHPNATPTFSWAIATSRAPMWGNFYARDGNNGKINGVNALVYVYNAGFPSAFGATPPSCYTGLYFDFSTCAGFLLVPDSVTTPPTITTTEIVTNSEVPEPMSLVLLGTGLAMAAGARRRFGRRP